MSDQADSNRPTRLTSAPLARPLAEARFQAAIVRALIDELQHVDATPDMEAQVVEELELLSKRILQVADTLRENDAEVPAESTASPTASISLPPESGLRLRNNWPSWLDEAPDDDRRSA
jgi:hypothetical protein